MLDVLAECPCCGAPRGAVRFRTMDDGYPVLACGRCRLLMLAPREDVAPGTTTRAHRYGHRDNQLRHNFERSVAEQRTRARILGAWLTRFARARRARTLLDIGTGLGYLPRMCADAGIDAIGIEPEDDARAYARLTNAIAVYGSFGDLRPAGRTTFDVVTLFNVLEHVDDLAGLLADVRQCMHAGSVPVIRMPNVSLFRLLRRMDRLRGTRTSVLQGAPDHRYGFTSPSLRRLLERNGFANCRYVATPLTTYAQADAAGARLLRAAAPVCDGVIRTLTRRRAADLFGSTIVAERA